VRSDTTFFNWHGVTTETEFDQASHMVYIKCAKRSHVGGMIKGEDCGTHPDFGFETESVYFDYKGWFTRKIVGHSFTLPKQSEDFNQLKGFLEVRNSLQDNPFYKEVGEFDCGATFEELVGNFILGKCNYTFRMRADPKNIVSSSVICAFGCYVSITYRTED